ncbi:MAG: L-2-hydroxyglutarate oxidase [Acidimicrobiales bacterium]
MSRVGIVGGGIVGLAAARQLLIDEPAASVVVFEKEATVATHQTGHNSGVVHAGIYYRPQSEKAVLCRRGVAMLRELCQGKGLDYQECGKLVVARNDEEAGRLPAMLQRATDLGVPQVHLVGPAGITDREPHVVGRAALVSPTTAIVDFGAIARALADEVVARGGQVRLRTPVTAIEDTAGGVRVHSGSAAPVLVDRLVVCAGLQTDRVSRLAGGPEGPAILPFRGEYYRLRPGRERLVNSLVYPLPDPRYPFLGVHFTTRIGGAVDVGPNALLGLAREGYRRRDVSARDIAEMARWPGSWRLARHHWRAGASELAGSLSKREYTRRARTYLPELRASDLVRSAAGVRAQAVDRDGALVDDFVIARHGAITSVRNAPSPAATASLAIAERIALSIRPRH